MEFRLSQSLLQTFLSHNGISAITEPFDELFISHNGISAITEPFANFSFSQWNFGYHGAFLYLSRILSHGGIHKTPDLGEDSFHIYHKEYLHRSTSLKTLPLDLEPPLQGKEYDPPYSKVIAKK
jgi:hypothetical protein